LFGINGTSELHFAGQNLLQLQKLGSN